MAVLPRTLRGLIAFCTARSERWLDAAAELGLSGAEITAWQSKIDAARARAVERDQAIAAARSATSAMRSAGRELRTASAMLVRKIKFHALGQADPLAVYQAALIPAPLSPSPGEAPGVPDGFAATLNPDGSLTISWQCKNPPGASNTVYTIRRCVGAGGLNVEAKAKPAIIATVGIRKFTDHDLPAATSVTYQIQAQRGGKSGPASSPFTVRFGGGGRGGVRGTVAINAGGGKMAA